MPEALAAPLTELTVQIVSAYLEKNRLAASELPALISAVYTDPVGRGGPRPSSGRAAEEAHVR